MTPYFDQNLVTIYHGDCRAVLAALPERSISCSVTSPPYWGLRDYGNEAQIGLEKTPDEFVAELVKVFRSVRRVMRDDGTLWLNLGDSYATGAGKVGECPGGGEQGDRWKGHKGSRGGSTKQPHTGDAVGPLIQPNRLPIPGLKPKDLVGIPWMVAFALRADGWYLRQDIIWHKPNPMPESVTDRCTKSHEYIFLLSKSERYVYNAEAVAEATIERLSQPNLESQIGSARVPGKTNGNMKAVGRKSDANGVNGRNVQATGSEATRRDLIGSFSNNPRNRPPVEFRNRRSVWTVTTKPFKGAHFATFPTDLIEPCILAGCPVGGIVLDPFFGAGSTGVVCQQHGLRCIGVELNESYCEIARKRLAQGVLFGGAA